MSLSRTALFYLHSDAEWCRVRTPQRTALAHEVQRGPYIINDIIDTTTTLIWILLYCRSSIHYRGISPPRIPFEEGRAPSVTISFLNFFVMLYICVWRCLCFLTFLYMTPSWFFHQKKNLFFFNWVKMIKICTHIIILSHDSDYIIIFVWWFHRPWRM